MTKNLSIFDLGIVKITPDPSSSSSKSSGLLSAALNTLFFLTSSLNCNAGSNAKTLYIIKNFYNAIVHVVFLHFIGTKNLYIAHTSPILGRIVYSLLPLEVPGTIRCEKRSGVSAKEP
ncbi:LOW QUALITY PROTEIN: hypothetical protein HID58_050894 [Brassica napus]|uniref:Uncharacterized protein n=1 Tax=Brassica napus TaxID=3708 RepID=A0ABQ8A7E6_BRANA|nr:LOW QUALITY PROTEIN: hypothetical protein HID58_050894 [Brassica napus]